MLVTAEDIEPLIGVIRYECAIKGCSGRYARSRVQTITGKSRHILRKVEGFHTAPRDISRGLKILSRDGKWRGHPTELISRAMPRSGIGPVNGTFRPATFHSNLLRMTQPQQYLNKMLGFIS